MIGIASVASHSFRSWPWLNRPQVGQMLQSSHYQALANFGRIRNTSSDASERSHKSWTMLTVSVCMRFTYRTRSNPHLAKYFCETI